MGVPVGAVLATSEVLASSDCKSGALLLCPPELESISVTLMNTVWVLAFFALEDTKFRVVFDLVFLNLEFR